VSTTTQRSRHRGHNSCTSEGAMAMSTRAQWPVIEAQQPRQQGNSDCTNEGTAAISTWVQRSRQRGHSGCVIDQGHSSHVNPLPPPLSTPSVSSSSLSLSPSTHNHTVYTTLIHVCSPQNVSLSHCSYLSHRCPSLVKIPSTLPSSSARLRAG
jgi:hypothetical protein